MLKSPIWFPNADFYFLCSCGFIHDLSQMLPNQIQFSGFKMLEGEVVHWQRYTIDLASSAGSKKLCDLRKMLDISGPYFPHCKTQRAGQADFWGAFWLHILWLRSSVAIKSVEGALFLHLINFDLFQHLWKIKSYVKNITESKNWQSFRVHIKSQIWL